MSGYGHARPRGPCANCGKPRGAIMSCSAWIHHAYVCSEACGKHLDRRIRNGMVDGNLYDARTPYLCEISHGEENRMVPADMSNLRVRIKQLEAQIRSMGSHPHASPVTVVERPDRDVRPLRNKHEYAALLARLEADWPTFFPASTPKSS